MSPKLWLVITGVAFVLGGGVGLGMIGLLEKPAQTVNVFEDLNFPNLLTECRPGDAEFIVSPAGGVRRLGPALHATYYSVWKSKTNPARVFEPFEKRLSDFVKEKEGTYQPQGGTVFSDEMVDFVTNEYVCHFPNQGVTGILSVTLFCTDNHSAFTVRTSVLPMRWR